MGLKPNSEQRPGIYSSPRHIAKPSVAGCVSNSKRLKNTQRQLSPWSCCKIDIHLQSKLSIKKLWRKILLWQCQGNCRGKRSWKTQRDLPCQNSSKKKFFSKENQFSAWFPLSSESINEKGKAKPWKICLGKPATENIEAYNCCPLLPETSRKNINLLHCKNCH